MDWDNVMDTFKTLSLLTAAIALCSLSSTAMAQSSSQNQSVTPDKYAHAAPAKTTAKRTVRVVEPLPTMAKPRSKTTSSLYKRAPYAKAASGYKGKFVINDHRHKVTTPVYYSKDALKSR